MARKKAKVRTPKSVDEKYTGPEPVWDKWETWSIDQFMREKNRAFTYYNYFKKGREMKPKVLAWMKANGYTKTQLSEYRAANDGLSTITMGTLAVCLTNGMPARHPETDDYIERMPGLESVSNSEEKLRSLIDGVLVAGKAALKAKKAEVKKDEVDVPKLSVRDRVLMRSNDIAEGLDAWLDQFMTDPKGFDSKEIKVSSYFTTQNVTQAHARVIREFYTARIAELEEVIGLGKNRLSEEQKQLVEGYESYSKPQLKKLLEALKEIVAVSDMTINAAKATRKVRKKRAPNKEKMVSRIKYLPTDTKYNLASINPIEILGAKELWVFNTKTRKLGKYVVDPNAGELSVKGTSILGYDEVKSVQKTVRKPEEVLAAFAKSGKVARRKFLDNIRAVETKLTGRTNNDTVLLKVE